MSPLKISNSAYKLTKRKSLIEKIRRRRSCQRKTASEKYIFLLQFNLDKERLQHFILLLINQTN
jgi:hypothetical protein